MRSTLDPIEEARARVRLKYMRARRAHPGAPAIGLVAQRISRKSKSGKLPAIRLLRQRWEHIVGPKLYRFCRPEKITGTKGDRTLVLKVLPAAAPLIQHQSATIRERVSVAAGGDVTKIKLVQGPLTPGGATSPPPAPARQLTPEERTKLKTDSERIADPALRAAIVALGAAVLTAADSDKPDRH